MRLVRPVVFSAVVALLGGVLGGAAAQGATDQTVSYHGYEVTVPADWSVVDLAKNPTACVRLDRPAVYLGRSTAQNCPARLVGGSEGLVLEPLNRAAKSSDGELQVAVKDAGVLATAYYAPGAEQTARKVLSTGRVTSKSQAVGVAPQAVAAAPSIVATGTIAAPGFDKCEAPTQSQMDAWLYPASPYRAIGIYTSGALRGCAQPNLTADWVTTNAAKGWQFLLIDVGMQAPCTTYKSRMSSVPATALTQGRNAAINAVTAAQALGFAPRSAIYSDIEYYVSTAACKASVLSYLSGWTQELNSRGYVGGAYVNASSGGADLVSAYTSTAYTRPDNFWFAHYNSTPGSSRFIPDTLWPNHQRVHQYAGDVTETHGGVEMDIDRNLLNLTAPPAPVTGFDATGSAGTAALKWTIPAGTKLGQVIVRRNTGATPPALPTLGTAVYAGIGSTATATGLTNATSYTFRTWVKDNYGKVGPGADTFLAGTNVTIGASPASIMYTGSVTLSSRATRVDNATNLSGVPVTLYSKPKNGTKWTTVATVTSSSTGVASSVQKPAVSTYYMWGYNGSPDLLGSRSAATLVEVRPALSAYLVPAAIRLGAAASLYGYLNPAHAGSTAYLQRRSGTSWVAVTTGKLTTNGKYAFSLKPTARGTYTYRVVWLADADHQGTQTASKVLTVS
ncbi:DUF1906 domain-containing protein [Kribbella catacumbae]|uniref:DUF1906 domain-containing protein n=1 Tax=Kribbella catacumbae TaxID=460086 RepID=UPI0004777814|nr:DUF1906 domain-containing protein [Kribbella catacumbae]